MSTLSVLAKRQKNTGGWHWRF